MISWTPARKPGSDEQALFKDDLEFAPLVLFHVSPARNLQSILENGFRSATELGVGTLTSVSYSKKSDAWSILTSYPTNDDYVVFAVRFKSLTEPGIKVNVSDIHVYHPDIQPEMLGFVKLPAGYR